MKNSFKICGLIFSIILSFNGCLKDFSISGVKSEVNNSEKIIAYLETQGDFINTIQIPAVDSALDVYDNLYSYEILDIRSSDKFVAGHIYEAINVTPANLFATVKSISSGKRIILVSQTGQAASYYTCLLRFAGFNKVYALKFGMVSWNPDFRHSWVDGTNGAGFTNKVYERPLPSPLPEVVLDNSVVTIKEKINSRIKSLITSSFGDPAPNSSPASTDLGELSNIYNNLDSTYTNTFIVCFGFDGLYFLGPNGQLDNPGHPPSSVFYRQSNGFVSDLRSTTYLQTIPSSKDIVVYSKYGHSSAFVVAYLRLLGYNAKSLLFGANWRENLPQSELQDYPYVTGN